jgi:hypothetical protein
MASLVNLVSLVVNDFASPALHLRHSAVDEQFHSGHETRILRCEEHCRFTDLIRLPHAAERDLRREMGLYTTTLLLRLAQAIEDRGINRPRTDGVHPDLAVF